MAENDGKIYITISNHKVSDKGSGKTTKPEDEKTKNENVLKDYVKDSFFHLIRSEAKTLVNYGVSNIGNFTGNYQAQRDTETVMGMINDITGLGMAFMAGTTATGGNPIGGLVAVGVAVVAKGVNFGLREYNNQLENRRLNYDINLLKMQSGLNTLADGSRGTEN